MAKIITVPNPLLRQKSKEINPPVGGDKKTFDLIKELKQTVRSTEGIKGVGISAIQIGVPKRVFIAHSDASNKFLVFINPVVVWKSKRMLSGVPRTNKLEGCLSVPGIWGQVKRHQVIKLRYQTISGQIITRRFRGFLGIICQHEYDHLEGILFTDRVLEQKACLPSLARPPGLRPGEVGRGARATSGQGRLFKLEKDKEGKEKLVEFNFEAQI